MSLARDLSDIIENIYSSITEPDLLPETYDRIARVLNGVGAVVIPVEPDPEQVPYVSGNLLEAMEEYGRLWWHRDPGVEAARRLERPLGVYATEDLLDAETMASHPIYTDFSTRHGFRYFLSMTLAPDPGRYLIFSVQRRIGAGPVSQRERRMATILRSHLIRSIELRYRLEYLNRLSRSVMDRLERSPNAMVILAPDGSVLFSNSAMNGFAKRGLVVRGRRLVAPRPQDQQKLDALLSACRDDLAPSQEMPQGVTTLATEGALPLVVRASRFVAHDRIEASLFRDLRDFILVTAIDPGIGRLHQPMEELRALGLTGQEARIACRVASGQNPKAVADEMNITLETCRSYLKSVFEKLGVSSQSQLSALVSCLQ